VRRVQDRCVLESAPRGTIRPRDLAFSLPSDESQDCSLFTPTVARRLAGEWLRRRRSGEAQ
jgi:hypothetical protein